MDTTDPLVIQNAAQVVISKAKSNFIMGLKILIISLALISVAVWTVRHIMSESTDESPHFFAHSSSEETRIRQLIDDINRHNLPYKVKYNKQAAIVASNRTDVQFDFSPLEKVEGLTAHESFNTNILADTEEHINELVSHRMSVPDQFDSRLEWPLCFSLHTIQNQGACGSCWAAASTSVMSDRLCISSNSMQQSRISTLDLVACCPFCGRCQGQPITILGFLHWKLHGLVSGGAYGSNEGCKPYEIASTCGAPCPAFFTQLKYNPECVRSCQSLYDGDYESDLRKAKSVYWLKMPSYISIMEERLKNAYDRYEALLKTTSLSTTDIIKREIAMHGPVVMCTAVWEPFMHYRSGIYVLSKFDKEGHDSLNYGHCMKIIGWGVEDGLHYWTIANSWGASWGEHGFGRISIGHAEEFLEMSVVAGLW